MAIEFRAEKIKRISERWRGSRDDVRLRKPVSRLRFLRRPAYFPAG